MSEGERKPVDATGDYAHAVRDGEPVAEPVWRSCRLVLTDERLVLATGDDHRTISWVMVPEDTEWSKARSGWPTAR